MYEICLLYKDSSNYIEASEKFKFRVDPWQIIEISFKTMKLLN
jgi:hypothetical protein